MRIAQSVFVIGQLSVYALLVLAGSVFLPISPLLEKCAATATHHWLALGSLLH